MRPSGENVRESRRGSSAPKRRHPGLTVYGGPFPPAMSRGAVVSGWREVAGTPRLHWRFISHGRTKGRDPTVESRRPSPLIEPLSTLTGDERASLGRRLRSVLQFHRDLAPPAVRKAAKWTLTRGGVCPEPNDAAQPGAARFDATVDDGEKPERVALRLDDRGTFDTGAERSSDLGRVITRSRFSNIFSRRSTASRTRRRPPSVRGPATWIASKPLGLDSRTTG